MLKLNVLLGRAEHLASSYKQAIKDYIVFFTKSQGSFKGVRKTYLARPETIDLPGERESKIIVTTVREKLDWLVSSNNDYIDALFSVEATNASGRATASLVVEGVDFGELSSLELLRLVSLLESDDLDNMYRNIPVRSDAENWMETTDELYKGKNVYELPKMMGIKKSVIKEQYIMTDPNIDPSNPNIAKYTPVVGVKDHIIELGDWSVQHFTGEISQRERAEILRRRTKLLVAAKEALKTANEAEVVASSINATKLFNFLHTGKI